ncbi:trypsin-like [Alligator sinensis]|uniref:Trypsin-like n=1 Tax=Alligator sinensis TaxID=38654 RepID=A0A1U7RIF2_ALLSI|nr:trypsin-like [Alligator sinensis]
MELLGLILLLASAAADQDSVDRIINGYPCVLNSRPWQAYVTGIVSCGGTLVSPSWVLTAAHCNVGELTVVLGKYRLRQSGAMEQKFNVTRVVPHPCYNKKTLDNDIMLLQLSGPVARSKRVWPVTLPRSCPNPGESCIVSGWGTTRSPGVRFPTVLHCAEIQILPNRSCHESYPQLFTSNMICAGMPGRRIDSCQGDSGGPLTCDDVLQGIVSWGPMVCGQPQHPGVYTRVCNYLPWIRSIIGNN